MCFVLGEKLYDSSVLGLISISTFLPHSEKIVICTRINPPSINFFHRQPDRTLTDVCSAAGGGLQKNKMQLQPWCVTTVYSFYTYCTYQMKDFFL